MPEDPCIDDHVILHIVIRHPDAPVSYLIEYQLSVDDTFESYVVNMTFKHHDQDLTDDIIYLPLCHSHSVIVHFVLCELFILNTNNVLQTFYDHFVVQLFIDSFILNTNK